MGIEIEIDPQRPKHGGDFHGPLPVVLRLTCDGDHGLFPEAAEFRHEDGYIRQYQMAMNAGWKERHDSAGREFLCPGCSGKGAK